MFRKLLLVLSFFSIMVFDLFADTKTDQLQLQEKIQRFYTRFTERTLESYLRSGILNNVKLRETSIKQYNLYDSEALKIVTSPYPEMNLLDLMVFVKLNKLIILEYWIPKYYGKSGDRIYGSFQESENDLDRIAKEIIPQERINNINEVISTWRKQNPDKFRVEKIRLDDFTDVVSKMQEDTKKDQSGFSLSHFIVDTKGAVQAVDQMVLVANRGIFLAQYIPALVRLQARIAAGEIIDDISIKFRQMQMDKKLNRSIASLGGVAPVLDSAVDLAGDMKVLTKDAKSLLVSYNHTFPDGINATENLKTLHSIIVDSTSLFDELKKTKATNQTVFTDVKNELKKISIFIAALVLGVGMLLSIFFWGCYYFFNKVKYRKLGEVV